MDDIAEAARLAFSAYCALRKDPFLSGTVARRLADAESALYEFRAAVDGAQRSHHLDVQLRDRAKQREADKRTAQREAAAAEKLLKIQEAVRKRQEEDALWREAEAMGLTAAPTGDQ